MTNAVSDIVKAADFASQQSIWWLFLFTLFTFAVATFLIVRVMWQKFNEQYAETRALTAANVAKLEAVTTANAVELRDLYRAANASAKEMAICATNCAACVQSNTEATRHNTEILLRLEAQLDRH